MSFLYRESKINHVQGINSVLGFLYERLIIIFNDSNKGYLWLRLWSITKLKQLFYTIERLVYLFFPKIYSKLKHNIIDISFFMSAYFIT